MEKFLKKDFKVIRNILALVLVFVTVMMATVSVSADSETTDDDEASDYSFYHLASVAATTLSDVKASTDLSMDSVFGTIPSNAAGGLLGYADSDTSKGIVGLVQSSLSTSSSTYSYRALAQSGYSQDGTYPFLPYVMVGAGLADSGADNYGVGLMNMSISRPLLGGLTFLVYLVADSVAWVFSKIIGILKMLNPFQFFASVSTNNIKPSTDDSNIAAIQIDGTVYSDLGSKTGFNNAVFDDVKKFVSYWYETMASFGSTIAYIVLFVSLTLLILGRNKAKHWGRIKRSVFRLVFIFVGIPICGSTYTVALNGIDENLSTGNTAAAKVIASTFVDFGSFVDANMEIDESDWSLPVKANGFAIEFDTSKMSEQTLAYNINYIALKEKYSDTTTLDKLDMDLSTDESGVLNSALSNLKNSHSEEFDATASETNNVDLREWIYDLLGRYISGDKLHASDYASDWVAQKWLSSGVDKDALQEYIEYSDSVTDLEDSDNPYYGSERWTYSSINPFGVNEDGNECKIGGFLSSSSKKTYSVTNFKPSPMSIYNYLNSQFLSTSVIIYSSDKGSSDAIRNLHYSVNIVGTGLNTVLYLITCLMLLLCDAIIGYVYGFGMLLGCVKRGIRLTVSVPGAMFGSMQSIARIISYTVLLILQVVVCVLCYNLFTELLYSLCILFLNSFLDSMDAAGIEMSGEILAPVCSIFVIMFLGWFTIQSVKMKSAIIKTMDEVADNMVRKFVLGENNMAGVNPAVAGATGRFNNNGQEATGGAKGNSATSTEESSSNKGLFGSMVANAKDTTKQEQLLSDMFGGDGSAVKDERRQEQRSQINRQAMKDKLSGTKQVAEGAAQVAAGVGLAVAGDPSTGASVAMDGIDNMGKGFEKKANAENTQNKKLKNLANYEAAGKVPDAPEGKNFGDTMDNTLGKGFHVAKYAANVAANMPSSSGSDVTNTVSDVSSGSNPVNNLALNAGGPSSNINNSSDSTVEKVNTVNVKERTEFNYQNNSAGQGMNQSNPTFTSSDTTSERTVNEKEVTKVNRENVTEDTDSEDEDK